MVSFVWSDPNPIYSGRGGTESFTIGHVRELMRRGIPTQILTIGLGKRDGRQYFPDIPFRDIASPEALRDVDDTIIYVNIPHAVRTKKRSYVLFHFPPLDMLGRRIDFIRGVANSTVIANSRFLRGVWADYLNLSPTKIRVVYPFADPVFGKVKRAATGSRLTKVLYAGRLHHEKGVYLLLEALHHKIVRQGFRFNVTNAGNQTEHGRVIEQMMRQHPWINVLKARHSPAAMAQLFARHDIVVMPSNHHYWNEAFGMISVEAQHAGCRVVASNAGGLPETNCGELILFEPGNSYALARAIKKAVRMGPMDEAEREAVRSRFTLCESVSSLLKIVGS